MGKLIFLKRLFIVLFLVVVTLLLVPFIGNNQEVVNINTYFGVWSNSAGVILVSTFIVGGLTGFIAAFLPSMLDMARCKRIMLQLEKAQKRVADLEKKQTMMTAHVDIPGES